MGRKAAGAADGSKATKRVSEAVDNNNRRIAMSTLRLECHHWEKRSGERVMSTATKHVRVPRAE